jgi:hypothetical protein
MVPNRYPVAAAKHSWLSLMKSKVFQIIPTKIEEIQSDWLKGYEGQSRGIIKKFSRCSLGN